MIALTQKAKYALKALAHLARRHGEGPVLIADISAAERIPRKFLEGILLELKRHGYLQSRKGRGGGYWLSRAPEDVQLGAVIRIFEGPLAPIPCVSKRYYAPCTDCVDEADCEVRRVMLEVKRSLLEVLDRTSLEEMVGRSGEPIVL